MRKLIRLGDTLREYGGQVTSAWAGAKIFGRPPARVGDAAVCNKHGLTRIREGSTMTRVGGAAVALDGHHCDCGCTLVSSLPDVGIAS
ncbi:PAAR domain-containing protein [Amantichitinum ursilacus]|uniref:PAAR motif protein n=1 Tax=Amantichitinum ursilacus TaxID=857265 RepID=A0A0N0GPK3_9NEIS|nr:PAAR domain-containing protein [Amantichitinum ursilacus]KPC53783.1 hypothetical protein WG78_08065 [Amantichitinum ursilacus]